MEQDPPLLPVSWERLYDGWYNYVKGHNPSNYFGVYNVVRFDTNLVGQVGEYAIGPMQLELR